MTTQMPHRTAHAYKNRCHHFKGRHVMRAGPTVPSLAHWVQGRWQVAAAPLVSLLDFRAPAALHSSQRGVSSTPGTLNPGVQGTAVSPAVGSWTTGCASHACMPSLTVRGFASSADSSSSGNRPKLQQQIRQLMKLVHPDQWASSDHPEARKENERSFKLLQDYLSAAKVITQLCMYIAHVSVGCYVM